MATVVFLRCWRARGRVWCKGNFALVSHAWMFGWCSNVVEKMLQHGTQAQRDMMIEETLRTVVPGASSPLEVMMKDQFANYVVQRMIELVRIP